MCYYYYYSLSLSSPRYYMLALKEAYNSATAAKRSLWDCLATVQLMLGFPKKGRGKLVSRKRKSFFVFPSSVSRQNFSTNEQGEWVGQPCCSCAHKLYHRTIALRANRLSKIGPQLREYGSGKCSTRRRRAQSN